MPWAALSTKVPLAAPCAVLLPDEVCILVFYDASISMLLLFAYCAEQVLCHKGLKMMLSASLIMYVMMSCSNCLLRPDNIICLADYCKEDDDTAVPGSDDEDEARRG